MKATYNKWMAEKFLEQLAKDTNAAKAGREPRDVLDMSVLKPMGKFPKYDEPDQTSPPAQKVAMATVTTDLDVSKESAGKHNKSVEKNPKACLMVLQEETSWDGGDGYFSDGSDYGDYVEGSTKDKICPKKTRLHRMGSAMDTVEPQLSETLLATPPPSNLHLGSATNTAPPDFSFEPTQRGCPDWEGGDAFFSDMSEMSAPDSPIEGRLENLNLDDKQPPSPPPKNSVDDTPMQDDWEGGDGYFSGSDYGDYADA